MTQTAINVYNLIKTKQLNEAGIAKEMFNRRVLPARQSIQYLLWNGWIMNKNGVYVVIK